MKRFLASCFFAVSLLLSIGVPVAEATSYFGVIYTPPPPTLTVSVSGGSGIASVTSSPAGINCTSLSGTCSFAFSPGTVTLTATPSPSNASASIHGTGTELFAWGGTACNGQSTGGNCTLTFSSSTDAAATFTPKDTDVWWIAASGGSDSNNCRSLSTPCSTIHHIDPLMSAGDTLFFADGTYNDSLGGNGGASTTDLVGGTWQKSTRFYGYTRSIGGTAAATVDGQYNRLPLEIFRTSYVEIGYLRFLHSSSQPGVIDGGTNGTGSVLAVTCSGGGVGSVAVSSAGSGFSASTTWSGAVFGGGIQNAQITVNANSGGGIGSVSVVNAGTGCTSGTVASATLRAVNIYVHDSAFAYSLPGTSGANLISLSCASCSNALFEQNWVWGYGSRYGVMLYWGQGNIARRNVARYDGAPNGQPKAGVTLYDEDNSIAENNIVLDFNGNTDSTSDNHAAIYATCSVPQAKYPYGMGTIGFYGNIAINTVFQTNGVVLFDSLCSTTSGLAGSTQSTLTYKDNVVASQTATTVGGVWLEEDSAATTNGGHHAVTFDHNTIWNINATAGTNDLFRIDNSAWSSVAFSNIILHGNTFTSAGCYRQDWVGTVTSASNIWFDCNNTLHQTTPSGSNSNPNYATSGTGGNYLEQIVSGPAFGTGSTGSNIGATIVNQYQNGSLTGNALWPFANQSFIQADLCQAPDTNTAAVCEASGNKTCTIYTRGHNAQGFCATSSVSLTKYIWQQLGAVSPFSP